MVVGGTVPVFLAVRSDVDGAGRILTSSSPRDGTRPLPRGDVEGLATFMGLPGGAGCLPGHSKQKPIAEAKMTSTLLMRDESANRYTSDGRLDPERARRIAKKET